MARLLLVLDHSTDRPERAMTALLAARALQSDDGHELVLWLQNEAVRLAVAGVAETLHEPGPESAAEALDSLTAAGTRLFASRRCLEIRELEPDALRPGAIREEPTILGRLVDEGWTPIAV